MMFGKKPDTTAPVAPRTSDETLDNVLRAEAALKRMRTALDADLAALGTIADADRAASRVISDADETGAPADNPAAAGADDGGAEEDVKPADRAE